MAYLYALGKLHTSALQPSHECLNMCPDGVFILFGCCIALRPSRDARKTGVCVCSSSSSSSSSSR